MKLPDIPDWLESNKRKWKQQKRSEFRAAMKAFDQFRLGCAYTPGFDEYCSVIEKVMKSWKQKMSIKEWGR